MPPFSHIAIAIFLFQAFCEAQVPPISPDICIGKTSFSNCDAANSKFAECNTKTDQQELIACVCNQELFSEYLICKGEVRQCLLSNTYDSDFDEVIAAWHEKCDSHLSTPVTTPIIAEPTITAGVDVCPSIIESCNRWIQETSACESSFTREIDINSCECGPSLVSLASVCEFDGNVSCSITTAESSNLWAWNNCPSLTGLRTTDNNAPITGIVSVGGTKTSGRTVGTTSPVIPISITPSFGLAISTSALAKTTSGSQMSWIPHFGLAISPVVAVALGQTVFLF